MAHSLYFVNDMMTYYDILGVSSDASEEEIKTAYHNLVKAFHPDTYKGDKDFAESKTQQIVEAYRTLSNETKRAEYDESLSHKSSAAKEEEGRNFGRKERTAKSAKARRKREKEIFRQIFTIMAIVSVIFMVTTLYFASQYSREVKKSRLIDERFEALYGTILNADTGERIDSAEAFLDAVAAERTSKGINGGGAGMLPAPSAAEPPVNTSPARDEQTIQPETQSDPAPPAVPAVTDQNEQTAAESESLQESGGLPAETQAEDASAEKDQVEDPEADQEKHMKSVSGAAGTEQLQESQILDEEAQFEAESE